MWRSGKCGHDAGGLVSQWDSTVTSQYLWCCQNGNPQKINIRWVCRIKSRLSVLVLRIYCLHWTKAKISYTHYANMNWEFSFLLQICDGVSKFLVNCGLHIHTNRYIESIHLAHSHTHSHSHSHSDTWKHHCMFPCFSNWVAFTFTFTFAYRIFGLLASSRCKQLVEHHVDMSLEVPWSTLTPF